MAGPRRRRWFQVSLRSLFLATAVAAVFCGGYSLGERSGRQQAERQETDKSKWRQIGLAQHNYYHGDSLLFPPAASTSPDTLAGNPTGNADGIP